MSDGLHVHVHMEGLAEALQNIGRALALIESRIIAMETHMSQQLDDIAAAVAQATSVEQSAVDLITGLASQIEALKTDPAALQQLATDLRAKSDALAAAVAANTVAAPTA